MTISAAHATPLRSSDTATMKQQSEQRLAVDLIMVLRPYRNGLRRWSVMRAMRARREAAGRSIPQKFEDDVERVFRRLSSDPTRGVEETGDAVFYRPQERAGEVWAVHADHADAWLDASGIGG